MKDQKEASILDPGNHSILKTLAQNEEMGIQEAAENTGIDQKRIRRQTEELKEQGFLDRDFSSGEDVIVLNQEHRSNLNDFKNQLDSFVDEHWSKIHKSIKHRDEELRKIKNDLESEKQNTDLVSKQKSLERKISVVNEALEQIESVSGTDREQMLSAFAKSNRVPKIIDNREVNFHGFNPVRKMRARQNVEEVLEKQPEEEEERTFFGNRWIKSDRLK